MTFGRWIAAWLLPFGIALTTPVEASLAAPAAPPACNAAAFQKIAPADTVIAFAARGAGRKPVCTIYGHVTTRDPGPNRIAFELTLPGQSNGRFLYIGIGGAGGYLPAIPAKLVDQGYAIAGSDKGTDAASIQDFSFMADKAKALDYDHRALHVTAQVTQQIARTYYGVPKLHRYMTGCSGGGHMGMNNARFYGAQDFDGIIAGACPMFTEAYLANVGRITQYIQKHPEGWLSPALLARAERAIIAAYDMTDGARDRIIHDDRNIRNFDLGILRKIGFTPAQIATFEVMRQTYRYNGTRVPPGGTIPGFPINTVSNWSYFVMGSKPPPWKNSAQAPVADIVASGAPFLYVLSDTMIRGKLGAQVDYVNGVDFTSRADLVRLEGPPAEHAAFDFGAFARGGGKLIFYQGVADESVPYTTMIGEFAAMGKQFPDLAQWARLYAIPGLMHCTGGLGPDDAPDQLLEAMANWVEKGVPPQAPVATRMGAARSFLLCPDPKRARLKSPGADPSKAENWTCETPAS
jgi:feruloyl esterase